MENKKNILVHVGGVEKRKEAVSRLEGIVKICCYCFILDNWEYLHYIEGDMIHGIPIDTPGEEYGISMFRYEAKNLVDCGDDLEMFIREVRAR